jgi:hypothetical protein
MKSQANIRVNTIASLGQLMKMTVGGLLFPKMIITGLRVRQGK